MKTTIMLGDIIDLIFIFLFIGIYIIGFIFMCFISPILDKKYFEQLRKEMEENDRTKNGIK